MAKCNGISTQTLRLYDKMGLLKPCIRNSETDYRYYDLRQSACLDMIQYMKTLGISLKEIKRILDEQDIDVITAMLQKRLSEIDRQIHDLNVTKGAIRNMASGLHTYRSIPVQNTVVWETLPARLIHSYPICEDFSTKGNNYFEAVLREVRSDLISRKIPVSYFCNVGTTIHLDDFARRNYMSNRVFIWADKYTAGILPAETIPGGSYLCVYFENYRRETEHREKLHAFAAGVGYRFVGDFVCESISEFPIFQKAERNSFIKIQIAVEKNT
ncbi:MAG: MerR family transcriptional regulator [Clostridiales bacterium]|nr:MerR family transcriptional regulator [Clostridiales bacterium]